MSGVVWYDGSQEERPKSRVESSWWSSSSGMEEEEVGEVGEGGEEGMSAKRDIMSISAVRARPPPRIFLVFIGGGGGVARFEVEEGVGRGWVGAERPPFWAM